MYVYCNNNPLSFVDPTGLRLDDNLEIDIKRKTSVEIERNAGTGQNNDIVRIKIGDTTVAKYDGAQSEKNMRAEGQNNSERSEPGTWKESPVGTLSAGDDYELTLLEASGSYNKPLSITSDTAQIPGYSEKGISSDMWFLAHSFSSRSTTREQGWSLGCQMLPDNSFTDFRNDLEGLGFKNGDSLPMSIRQDNFVERR